MNENEREDYYSNKRNPRGTMLSAQLLQCLINLKITAYCYTLSQDHGRALTFVSHTLIVLDTADWKL